ncbi:hypothetical protein sos41_40190 [Alphaproteobacteria bacterium SO-S41]|nr:hypothetical protein sos41_40190 [Alphaproteobacteria bacterium SO-S41]
MLLSKKRSIRAVVGAGVCLLALTYPAAAQSVPGASVTFLQGVKAGDLTYNSRINANGRILAGITADGLLRWVDGKPTLVKEAFVIEDVGGISGDGRVIFGTQQFARRPGSSTATFRRTAFIWTEAGGYRILDLPPGLPDDDTSTYGAGVNTLGTVAIVNASTLVGSQFQDNFNVTDVMRAYRWTEAGGYQSLGSLPGVAPAPPANGSLRWGISAQAISGDGSVIAGLTFDGTPVSSDFTSDIGAFRWTEATGLTSLPFLSATPAGASRFAEARGISRDGSTIVGASRSAAGDTEAVFWKNGAITSLGILPGATGNDRLTYAQGANGDGSVIVGYSNSGTSDNGIAWRWTKTTGIQDLNQVVRNAGFDLGPWRLTQAWGVSDDGQFLTGDADSEDNELAFVLQLASITQTKLVVQLTLPGVTLTSIVNQTFNTNVRGLLNGAVVYNNTFTDAINSTAGATALTRATDAVRVGSGLRRLIVEAPRLIANTTTVLSSTNAIVNTLTSTQITTAAVTNSGPAIIATGDLGTCATAAVNNLPPTGCSLPGTPYTVDDGTINTNIYTNTINSITPTTTPTVNQLITAEWRVSAIMGNQIGTVHAQSATAGFDQGTRFTALMLEGGSAAEAGPRSVEVASLDPVPVPVADGWYAFGEGFGAWTDYDADPSRAIAASDSSLTGFSAGVAGSAGSDLVLGAAVQWARSEFDVHDRFAPENLTLELTQLGLFGAWQTGDFTLAGSAGYGTGTADTIIGNQTVGLARASKDETLWTVGLEAGYDIDLGDTILTPVVGLYHVNVSLDGFTEAGTGPLLTGFESDAERTRLYMGVDAMAQWGAADRPVTLALKARAFNDLGDSDGLANLAFLSAPTVRLAAHGPAVGRWGADLGAGLAMTIGDRTDLYARYDGQFREGAQTHAVSAGIRLAF